MTEDNKPETTSLVRAALISGSLNLAPAGISSNLAFGRSGVLMQLENKKHA
uniref:hypothetical protein n=1 Tax=Rummeliibacillus pycnus TaxID=101070 RepID=UPI001474052C|nr:hypothetical protein [Rummeliibacillus pycnus]